MSDDEFSGVRSLSSSEVEMRQDLALVKAGIACKYSDRARDRRELVERLQRRLKHAETANANLNAKLVQSGLAPTPVEPAGVGRMSDPTEADLDADDLPGERERGDEVMEEVSFLSRRAGGEHHFLGSASGIPFANLVSTTVEVTSRSPGQRAISEGRTHRPAVASSIQSTSPTTLPIETSFLPPERVARDLHRAYFDHDHLSYPFLHRASVLAALDRAYQDPVFLERDAFSSFVFDMILAIATANVHKFDFESLPNAEGYRLRAGQRLNEVLQQGNLPALQAILLLGQYRMINSIQDTSSSECS
ncbi:hypothetical protein NUU61_000247 [Penicillium alfredii]|uniref:Transcription factor domain-containing protein n=1 Tax=Penicillium alfredii TaxID=1506179 RepID=A0A9W9G9D1_9EURO|nr:uncharacterized protein NUU61_000247 [Penicillium alfredii]KAJ5114488.1 hypothetical protein NUU61_000247 [Penicillium alfredii]